MAAEDPEFKETTIQVLQAPSFQFIPELGREAYLKIEVLKGRSTVFDQVDREMLLHRHSWSDAVSGPFDILFSIPYGIDFVSGGAL